MALPVILVDSATGSDTLASGAGPSTALTGTSASTSANGLIVTLDGSPDLTNVAIDGSHVIFLNDTTAGNRNFAKITAKDDVAKTVTVANAFGLSLSGKSWAIGGKRASIGSTLSRKLFENNGANGDMQEGWACEMQSGHTETLTTTLNWRGSFSLYFGVLRGAANAAVMPVLTWSNNGAAIIPYNNWKLFSSFEMRNSSATKTNTRAFNNSNQYSQVWTYNIKCNHATNYFAIFSQLSVYRGEWHYCNLIGVSGNAFEGSGGVNGSTVVLFGNVIKGGARGISGNPVATIINNIFSGQSDIAIYMGTAPTIIGNTIYGCSTHAIVVYSSYQYIGGAIINNIITNCSGYGVYITYGDNLTPFPDGFLFMGNNIYACSSGATYPTTMSQIGGNTKNPSLIDPTNGNWSPGVAIKGLGFPLTFGPSTNNYPDPGAVQRLEPSKTTNTYGSPLINTYNY